MTQRIAIGILLVLLGMSNVAWYRQYHTLGLDDARAHAWLKTDNRKTLPMSTNVLDVPNGSIPAYDSRCGQLVWILPDKPVPPLHQENSSIVIEIDGISVECKAGRMCI